MTQKAYHFTQELKSTQSVDLMLRGSQIEIEPYGDSAAIRVWNDMQLQSIWTPGTKFFVNTWDR
jgi:hypothetical protein